MPSARLMAATWLKGMRPSTPRDPHARPPHQPLTILQNVLGLEESGAKDLVSLNALLKGEGFEFNAAGGADGLTQGSEAAHLEQSSTVADLVPHTFGCGATKDVPLAFLELIRRHEGFRGFLGQNAKGIFASTHAR